MVQFHSGGAIRRVLLGLSVVAAVVATGTPAAADLKTAAGEPREVIRIWLFENDLGWTALLNGDLSQAETRFKAAIEAVRPYAKADPRLMARSYCDLAQVLYQQARYDQAEPLARWALKVRERVAGVSSDSKYQSLYLLAQIHCAQRRYKDAEPLLQRALALQEKSLGAGRLALAPILDDLVWINTETGDLAKAAPFAKRALEIRLAALPADSIEIADASDRYAALLRRLDRQTEANWLEARARVIRKEAAAAPRPRPTPTPPPLITPAPLVEPVPPYEPSPPMFESEPMFDPTP